jgi:hypothetical protein
MRSAQGERVIRPGRARPPLRAMIACIDDHRAAYGVEPICRGAADCPVGRTTAMTRAAPIRPRRRREPSATLNCAGICRDFEENFGVYGVRKVWRQLRPRRDCIGPQF